MRCLPSAGFTDGCHTPGSFLNLVFWGSDPGPYAHSANLRQLNYLPVCSCSSRPSGCCHATQNQLLTLTSSFHLLDACILQKKPRLWPKDVSCWWRRISKVSLVTHTYAQAHTSPPTPSQWLLVLLIIPNLTVCDISGISLFFLSQLHHYPITWTKEQRH